MKKVGLLIAVVWLACSTAKGQLQITSLKFNGELDWTNPPVARGLYIVETAGSLDGPWHQATNVADLDYSFYNRLAAQVSLTNTKAFFRVVWIPPDPEGDWEYLGYDPDGSLAVTGKLALAPAGIVTTNGVARIQGTWNLGYRGYTSPSTNIPWYFVPQVGAGALGGGLVVDDAHFGVWWPTNCIDCSVSLDGVLLGNSYTGRWTYSTWTPVAGRFEATRIPSTNSINNKPQSPE